MRPIAFPAADRPQVSVVMPTHDRLESIQQALSALGENTEPVYEVIVVDNASRDGTADTLAAATTNLRILRNRRNEGFGIACNQGAAAARAPLLAFLNNDAFVHRGWLRPLLDAVCRPRVGAVGPRFLNVDGSVQEAGGLVFADPTTGPYGTSPESSNDVARPRVVDYVSAACLMVKRQAFAEVGGFDTIYSPAYFEDVDLCLALTERGYLTLYEPRSIVTHAFGWSGPTTGTERTISSNRAWFALRWSEVLKGRPRAAAESRRNLAASRDAPLADRVLIVAGESPESQTAAATTAREIVRSCISAYVAVVGVPADEEPGLRASGVAVADATHIDAWLAGHRFHFDVILEPPDCADAVSSRIRATQPQAHWIASVDLPKSELANELARLGIALDASAGDGVDDV